MTLGHDLAGHPAIQAAQVSVPTASYGTSTEAALLLERLKRGLHLYHLLLPSASCSLDQTVSAPTRKPLRIFRYMLSVSMNYFIPGSTGH